MAFTMSLLFITLALSSLVTGQACTYSPPQLTVATTVGPVRGFINGSTPSVRQFLNIPYAEPPTGALRFSSPVPEAPVALVDATHPAPSCPQYQSQIPSVYNTDAPQFLIAGPTAEDCLSVSIWTPVGAAANNGTRGLPVLAWIYGGGFTTGGVDVPYQIPDRWVQRTQKHVVVALNYRVNIFGFPNARALNLTAQNVGLMDQRLAVEWVHANIAAFGGDPSRITLWGQSAGAMSVGYYDFAYAADPLVHALIMDSGTALLPNTNTDTTHSNFTFVASHLGCGNLTAGDELACMRALPVEDIEAFLLGYTDNGTTPALSFIPVDDEATKFADYPARAAAGLFSKTPAIIGTNANEGASLVAFAPTGPNLTAANAETYGSFLCPAVQTTAERFAAGAATFRYHYEGNFSNVAPRPWEGAYHSSELPLVFGTSGEWRGGDTPLESALSVRMGDLWIAFAGNPEGALVERGWESYTPNGTAVAFGRDGKVMVSVGIQGIDAPCG